jgi:hypothetical protein
LEQAQTQIKTKDSLITAKNSDILAKENALQLAQVNHQTINYNN